MVVLSKNLKIAYIILSLIFFSACESNKINKIEPKTKVTLDILYKTAYNSFQSGNYSDAINLFKQVEKDYSYTEWASKSSLMQSYIYYDSGNYIQALINLQRFKTRYSGSKDLDYAEYLIAICMFEQINFSSLSQEPTELALKQFNKILKNFPNSSYASDAKFKIDLINEQLAAKEMYIARYYLKRDKWLAALYRLNNVVKYYQNTIFIEEALHRLVEINYKLGNIDSAKKYAAILGYNFNDSDWFKKSYNIIKKGTNIEIEKKKQKKTLKEKINQIIQLN